MHSATVVRLQAGGPYAAFEEQVPGYYTRGLCFCRAFEFDSTSTCVWPGRKEIPIGWLFFWITGEDVLPLPPPDRSAHAASTQPGHAWFGRLCSSSHAALSPFVASSSGSTIAVPCPAPPSTSLRRLRPVTPLRSLPKAPSPLVTLTPAVGVTPVPALPSVTMSNGSGSVSTMRMGVSPARMEPIARPRPPPLKRCLVPVGRPLGLLRPRLHPPPP